MTRVHPKTIAMMQEISIDISWHRSKLIDEFYGLGIKTVSRFVMRQINPARSFQGQRKIIHKGFLYPGAAGLAMADSIPAAGGKHPMSVIDKVLR